MRSPLYLSLCHPLARLPPCHNSHARSGTLSDRVSKVLQKQEKEFLAAYRAHMYNVQKELNDLRAKVDEAELQMKKDSKIKKLEEERDWYRKEALRLDTHATAMKKDIKYMKEKRARRLIKRRTCTR